MLGLFSEEASFVPMDELLFLWFKRRQEYEADAYAVNYGYDDRLINYLDGMRTFNRKYGKFHFYHIIRR
jgi:Zn-dependent protease with chaperone function